MAKLTGKNLYVEFAGTDLSATLRNFSVSDTQEQADVTAGADDYRNYANTVKTTEATFELLVQDWANGGSALAAAVYSGAQGTLIWGPEGTAAGKPKRGFYATITQYDEALPFDDAYTASVTMTMAGTAMAFSGTSVW